VDSTENSEEPEPRRGALLTTDFTDEHKMDADGMSDRPAELPPNEAIKAKQWDIVTTKQSKYANVLTGLTEWTGWKIPRKRRGRAHVR
jgi:hypothetical protein